jgi:DNA polymerase III alpha subunit
MYIKAARKAGVKILRVDVNKSQVNYSVDGVAIRKGLVSVKGVGEKAAIDIVNSRPEGGWKDAKGMADSVNHRKVTGVRHIIQGDYTVGVIGKLNDSGALERLKNEE